MVFGFRILAVFPWSLIVSVIWLKRGSKYLQHGDWLVWINEQRYLSNCLVSFSQAPGWFWLLSPDVEHLWCCSSFPGSVMFSHFTLATASFWDSVFPLRFNVYFPVCSDPSVSGPLRFSFWFSMSVCLCVSLPHSLSVHVYVRAYVCVCMCIYM